MLCFFAAVAWHIGRWAHGGQWASAYVRGKDFSDYDFTEVFSTVCAARSLLEMQDANVLPEERSTTLLLLLRLHRLDREGLSII